MNASIKKTYGFTSLIIEAENVKIVEDISEVLYKVDENGKKDITKRLGYDIKDEYLRMFDSILSDIIYYREREYDSTELIKSLIDKLPEKDHSEIIKALFDVLPEKYKSSLILDITDNHLL